MTPAELVAVSERAPSDPLARACLKAYADELRTRLGIELDGGDTGTPFVPPNGLLLVATRQNQPVGCGGLVFAPGEAPEIKRLWVSSAARGAGLGRRLLSELEDRAARTGASSVRLDTNGGLHEALALYRRNGYCEIPSYNDNPHAHHWFEKRFES